MNFSCSHCISTFIYLSISVSSCLSFHLFIIYLHKFLSFASLHHLSIYNSLYCSSLSPLLEHISYHLSLKLSTYLSNYLSIYLSVQPSSLPWLSIHLVGNNRANKLFKLSTRTTIYRVVFFSVCAPQMIQWKAE